MKNNGFAAARPSHGGVNAPAAGLSAQRHALIYF